MTSLTHNRPDGGFGPMYNGDLTSTFEDVVLVPLASWVFLLLLAVALPLALLRKRRSRSFAYDPASSSKGHALTSTRPGWPDALAFFFALAVMAMAALEMARLSKLGWGIGLLPFTPAVTAVAIVVYLARYRIEGGGGRVLAGAVVVYWAVSVAVQSVKLRTVVRLGMTDPRVGSAYPESDQAIDVGVLVGCLGVLLLLGVLGLVRPRKN